METKSHGKISRIRTENHLKMARQLVHADHAISGETSHDHGMVLARLRQPCHGNVTITNRLNLEDAAAFGNGVECLVDSLKKRKDLRGFTDGTPRGESC